MKIPQELQSIVTSTPETLHGAARFVHTRVFVQSLFDYVMKGHSVDVFPDHFPDVTREQAEAVLNWESDRLRREFGYELTV